MWIKSYHRWVKNKVSACFMPKRDWIQNEPKRKTSTVAVVSFPDFERVEIKVQSFLCRLIDKSQVVFLALFEDYILSQSMPMYLVFSRGFETTSSTKWQSPQIRFLIEAILQLLFWSNRRISDGIKKWNSWLAKQEITRNVQLIRYWIRFRRKRKLWKILNVCVTLGKMIAIEIEPYQTPTMANE